MRLFRLGGSCGPLTQFLERVHHPCRAVYGVFHLIASASLARCSAATHSLRFASHCLSAARSVTAASTRLFVSSVRIGISKLHAVRHSGAMCTSGASGRLQVTCEAQPASSRTMAMLSLIDDGYDRRRRHNRTQRRQLRLAALSPLLNALPYLRQLCRCE